MGSSINQLRRVLSCSLVASLSVLMGCEPTYAPRRTIDLRPQILEVSNHHGGTRHCTLVHEEIWYQSLGPELEILSGKDGLRITSHEIEPFGQVGPISDMCIVDGEMWVVYAGDRVVRFGLDNPRRPRTLEQWKVEDLGLYPIEISLAGGDIWISGRDGTTAMSQLGTVRLSNLGRVGQVVETPNGLFATAGRRIHRVDNGDYAGAATHLLPLPSDFGVDGALVFVLQATEGASFGLMGPDLRELDSKTILGTVRSVRTLDDRIFIVGDHQMSGWKVDSSGALFDPVFVQIKGARDLDILRENYYAVGGTFGRAVFRMNADANGEADEFISVERTPGRLEKAITDGQRILAGSDEGNWLYTIGGKCELSDKTLNATTGPRTSVTMSWGQATIDSDREGVTITLSSGETMKWSPRGQGLVYTLEVSENRLWIGFDEGIHVMEFKEDKVSDLGNIILEGPVAWLFRPRVGDNIGYVSAYGGIGSAEVVPDPNADEGLVRRVRPEDAIKAEREMRKAAGLPPMEQDR